MSPSTSPRIRVLTLNLQHCAPNDSHPRGLSAQAISDSRQAMRVIEELAEQIDDSGADVVALQEVDCGQSRSGEIDQVSALMQALGWPSGQFCAAYAGAVNGVRRRPIHMALRSFADDYLGPVMKVTGQPLRGYGIGLLSRFPVSSWHMTRLGRGPATIVRRDGAFLGHKVFTSSMRVLLAAFLQTPVGPVAMGCTHLATRGDQARRQLVDSWAALQQINSCRMWGTMTTHAGDSPAPSATVAHVLAGDFNMNDESLRQCGVGRPVGEGPTFPSSDPRQRIDHIILDPLEVSSHGLVLPSPGSWNASDPASVHDAAPSVPTTASPLMAVDWGVKHFCVSDHRGPWVDLAPVAR